MRSRTLKVIASSSSLRRAGRAQRLVQLVAQHRQGCKARALVLFLLRLGRILGARRRQARRRRWIGDRLAPVSLEPRKDIEHQVAYSEGHLLPSFSMADSEDESVYR